jgi:hypothetical protein
VIFTYRSTPRAQRVRKIAELPHLVAYNLAANDV